MQHNGGVFLPPWGKMEQWLISTQHDDADVDRFLANFETLAAALGELTGGRPGCTGCCGRPLPVVR